MFSSTGFSISWFKLWSLIHYELKFYMFQISISSMSSSEILEVQQKGSCVALTSSSLIVLLGTRAVYSFSIDTTVSNPEPPPHAWNPKQHKSVLSVLEPSVNRILLYILFSYLSKFLYFLFFETRSCFLALNVWLLAVLLKLALTWPQSSCLRPQGTRGLCHHTQFLCQLLEYIYQCCEKKSHLHHCILSQCVNLLPCISASVGGHWAILCWR